MNQSTEKCLICNKDIRPNDASSMTDDGWKTQTNLAKTWSSMVLPINHQNIEYTQVHERICEFGRHSLIRRHWNLGFGNWWIWKTQKKDNEADTPGAEAAAASKLIPSYSSLLSPRSSTTRTHSSTENTKQFERICFFCNEIRPCDSNSYSPWIQKCTRSVDVCCECNWRKKWS